MIQISWIDWSLQLPHRKSLELKGLYVCLRLSLTLTRNNTDYWA